MGGEPEADARQQGDAPLIVVDTSAWIEFLRGTGHVVASRLRELITRAGDVAITEIVLMELLAGARSGKPAMELRSRLLAFPILPLEGLADIEEAARMYRVCRDAGRTIGSLNDCLIAVPVIRAGARLLHNDADFEVIAQHSDLRLYG